MEAAAVFGAQASVTSPPAPSAVDDHTPDPLPATETAAVVTTTETKPLSSSESNAAALPPKAATPTTDELLDEWVEAKRAKDFGKADGIRAKLRSMGIEPETARPKSGAPPPRLEFDAATERKLSEWVKAKRGKEFDTADRLRDELRAAGVDPEVVRPIGPSRPTTTRRARSRSPLGFQPYPPPSTHGFVPPVHRYDRTTEAKLETWIAAKRKKDFATADKLREELRRIGIDPDTARPAPLPQQARPHHASRDYERERESYHSRSGYRSYDEPPPWGRGGGGSGGGGSGGRGGWREEPPRDAPRHYDHPPPDRGYGGARSSYGGGYGDRYESRGPGGGGHRAPPPPPMHGSRRDGSSSSTEAKLERWVAAKRARDFVTADAIRAELRAIGVNPDSVRPAHPPSVTSGRGRGGYN